MSQPTLTVVGLGIKFASHLTSETRSYIESAPKLLYLVNDVASKKWLESVNDSAESLDPLYFQNRTRIENYHLISQYILSCIEKYTNVCVVLYGHPGVFATPALDAARAAKNNGVDVLMLPAISAEDCLFADLLVDPGNYGCQSFEATDFILYERNYDASCHLILWQVGIIGAVGLTDEYDGNQYIDLLINYLLETYKPQHEVILYEAAQLPGFSPLIIRASIENLKNQNYSPLTTLYIPPSVKKQYNAKILTKLQLD